MSRHLLHTTSIVQKIILPFLKPDSVGIDCTMGNGHDTLYLAKQLMPNGEIYSFDIQERALKETSRLLTENGFGKYIGDRIHLILDGHERLSQYLHRPVDCIMYNLGYLPGGDKRVVTSGDTTTDSLRQGLDLLKRGGVIAIIVYHGHTEGKKEKEEVESFLSALPTKTMKVIRIDLPYNDNYAPIAYLINKK